MKIRKARLADTAIIADYNLRLAWETEALALDPRIVRRGVRALLKDAAKGIYFVAVADGEVVGQLLITYEWSDWRNGNFWWIQSVYVRAEYRRRGVFRALFNQIHQSATGRRDVCGLRLYVEKQNRGAQRTYAELGLTRQHYEIFETVWRSAAKQ